MADLQDDLAELFTPWSFSDQLLAAPEAAKLFEAAITFAVETGRTPVDAALFRKMADRGFTGTQNTLYTKATAAIAAAK